MPRNLTDTLKLTAPTVHLNGPGGADRPDLQRAGAARRAEGGAVVKLQHAQVFTSYAIAVANRCGNESVISVADEMGGAS